MTDELRAVNADGFVTGRMLVTASLQINTGTNGRPVLKFHPDGTIEIGEGYTPQDASDHLIDKVLRPAFAHLVQPRLADENDRLRAELARQQAGVRDMETITQALILAKVAQERAATVAWINQRADASIAEPHDADPCVQSTVEIMAVAAKSLAVAIEAGAHVETTR